MAGLYIYSLASLTGIMHCQVNITWVISIKMFVFQPSRDTASDGGTSLVVGSWDDEKNMVRKQSMLVC